MSAIPRTTPFAQRVLITLGLVILGSFALTIAFEPSGWNGGTFLASSAHAENGTTPSTVTTTSVEALAADATAQPQTAPEPDEPPAIFDPVARAAATVEPVDGPLIFPEDPSEKIAAMLRQKEAELRMREEALAQREQYLEALRLETEETLRRIEQVRDQMQQLAGVADQQRQRQVKRWIEIYQKMDPAKVATVMMELDPNFQAELIAQMETSKAAKILNSFPPDKAAELSSLLRR